VRIIEDVKIRLSVLWMLTIVWGMIGTIMMMFQASVMEQILAGEMEGIQITSDLLLGLSVLMLIPLIMAFLSLVLKDKANRWANIIVGVVYGGYSLIDVIVNLSKLSSFLLKSRPNVLNLPHSQSTRIIVF